MINKFFDIILSDNPRDSIINNENFMFSFIKELKDCKGFNQLNKWHIYDVYEHILHVIDNCDNIPELRIAALFHDIGKPLSFSLDKDGVGHFYGHYNYSNDIFISFAKRNKLDEKLVKRVSKLILAHDLRFNELKESKIKDLLKDFDSFEYSLLFKLKRADLLGQNPIFHYLLDEYNNEEKRLIKYIKK